MPNKFCLTIMKIRFLQLKFLAWEFLKFIGYYFDGPKLRFAAYLITYFFRIMNVSNEDGLCGIRQKCQQ